MVRRLNTRDNDRRIQVALQPLVHGEEETSGRSYLMLEGTDGKVYHVYRTPEMEELRSQRGLQINSFIRLRKIGLVV
jgi:hypothetical protein